MSSKNILNKEQLERFNNSENELEKIRNEKKLLEEKLKNLVGNIDTEATTSTGNLQVILQNNSVQALPKPTIKITNMATPEVSFSNIMDYISKSIPKFSGLPSPARGEELRRYLMTSEIYYNILSAENKVIYMKFLLTLTLCEDAASLVQNQTINDFAALKKILEDNYLPKRTLQSLSDELRACIQNQGEKINDYGRRILEKKSACVEAINTLYPNDRGFHDENNQLALKTFKKGLKNDIMRQHACLQEGTLEELIRKLSSIEELNDEKMQGNQFTGNPNKSRGQMNNNFYQQGNTAGNYAGNNFFSQSRRYPGPGIGLNNQNNTGININRKTPIVCFRCNKPGHTSRDCRVNVQRNTYNNNHMGYNNIKPKQEGNNQIRVTKTEKCDFCKSAGHNISECHIKVISERYLQEQLEAAVKEVCKFCRIKGHSITDCYAKKLWDQSQLEEAGNE